MFTENSSLNSSSTNSTNQEQFLRTQKWEKNSSPEPLNYAISKVKAELRNNKKHLMIEKIKNIVIDMIYYSEEQIKVNFSDYLSEKLNCNYTYMSNLFLKVNGNTIQDFIIRTKIERVKELLIYDELTLTEIAFKLHYSSVGHISNQFKKVTGVNPSTFLASLPKNKNQAQTITKITPETNTSSTLRSESLSDPINLHATYSSEDKIQQTGS